MASFPTLVDPWYLIFGLPYQRPDYVSDNLDFGPQRERLTTWHNDIVLFAEIWLDDLAASFASGMVTVVDVAEQSQTDASS